MNPKLDINEVLKRSLHAKQTAKPSNSYIELFYEDGKPFARCVSRLREEHIVPIHDADPVAKAREVAEHLGWTFITPLS